VSSVNAEGLKKKLSKTESCRVISSFVTYQTVMLLCLRTLEYTICKLISAGLYVLFADIHFCKSNCASGITAWQSILGHPWVVLNTMSHHSLHPILCCTGNTFARPVLWTFLYSFKNIIALENVNYSTLSSHNFTTYFIISR
jgi:hypothetical protein